jgi:hypothetical protein
MDDQASRYEPDERTLRMVGGGWCRVEDDRVTLLADDGVISRSIDLTEVVSVRRGGPDLTLVRRAADPVTFTLTQVEQARQIESAIEAIIMDQDDEHDDGPPRRRWRFWKRP